MKPGNNMIEVCHIGRIEEDTRKGNGTSLKMERSYLNQSKNLCPILARIGQKKEV